MSATMDVWAVVEYGKPLEKIQQSIPELLGTEVLVKVTHCGVCHSDLHFWEGYFDVGGGQKASMNDMGIKLPQALGHEILGDVVKLGPDVSKGVSVGARCLVYPWIGCQQCRRCLIGQDSLCIGGNLGMNTLGMGKNGGFAAYVVVPHPRYLLDAGNLDPALACTFGCSGVTALSAVTKVLPQAPEDYIVLIGAGGVGLTAISMLKAKGHNNILSVDISDEKLEAAKKVGAKAVVNSKNGDAGRRIIEIVGGPVYGVIDFVNNSATATMVNGILGRGSTWVQVGVMGGSIELSLVNNVFRATTIKSSLTGSLSELKDVVELAQGGKLTAIPVIEMPWDQANKAMNLLHEGKITGRAVLVKS